MKTRYVILSLIFIVAMFVRTMIGVFIIQPIGVLPEGTTIVYWRGGTSLDFIDSPDGIVLRSGASLTIFSRAAAISSAVEPIMEREIIRLPYSSFLFELSL